MKLVDYIHVRISEGAFRDLGPLPGCQSFHGMLYTYVTAQHLFDAGHYYPKATHDEVIRVSSAFPEWHPQQVADPSLGLRHFCCPSGDRLVECL
jgi:hypothetical protein